MEYLKKLDPRTLTIGKYVTCVLITILVIYLSPLKNINIVEPSIRDIDPQEIYNRIQENPDHYIFIDVRPKQMYETEHAKGSMNVELHKFYFERKNLPKSGKEIILICTEGVASGVAYSYLEHYGFMNLYRVKEGIELWKKEDLPTVKAKP